MVVATFAPFRALRFRPDADGSGSGDLADLVAPPYDVLSDADVAALRNGLSLDLADHMIENVVATYALPLGIVTNVVVKGREVLVPMVIEEPSVVAGCSFSAKLALSLIHISEPTRPY